MGCPGKDLWFIVLDPQDLTGRPGRGDFRLTGDGIDQVGVELLGNDCGFGGSAVIQPDDGFAGWLAVRVEADEGLTLAGDADCGDTPSVRTAFGHLPQMAESAIWGRQSSPLSPPFSALGKMGEVGGGQYLADGRAAGLPVDLGIDLDPIRARCFQAVLLAIEGEEVAALVEEGGFERGGAGVESQEQRHAFISTAAS